MLRTQGFVGRKPPAIDESRLAASLEMRILIAVVLTTALHLSTQQNPVSQLRNTGAQLAQQDW